MNKSVNLLDILSTLYQWRRPILITCLAAGLGSALISVTLLDDYFKATTIFYPASPDLARPEKYFGNEVGSRRFFGSEEDMDRLLSIANSGELVDHMIQQFDLYQHYGIDTTQSKAPLMVRKEFGSLYQVVKNEYGAIEMSVEDKDRELSARMANAARKKVNDIARSMIREGQEKLIDTYEENLRDQEQLLDQVTDSLKILREKYGLYNISSQSEIFSGLLANTESSLLGSQSVLNSYEEDPRRFRDSIPIVRARVSALEKRVEGLQEKVSKMNEGMGRIEVLERQLQRSSQELSITKENYKQLLSTRKSDIPAIHLVEAATTPVEKSRPRRSLIVLACTFIAFVLSVVAVLLLETYKEVDWKNVFHGKA